jgi:tRNA uridine 5-carboxymethylaminomethyl modification enzyme
VEPPEWRNFQEREQKSRDFLAYAESRQLPLKPEVLSALGALGAPAPRKPLTLGDFLRRPDAEPALAARLDALQGGRFGELWEGLDRESRRFVLAEIKYKEYLEREAQQVAVLRAADRVRIPEDLRYAEVSHLTAEVRQRLEEVRPRTLGQASRVSGVTPAAIAVLEVHLRRAQGKNGNSSAR